MSFLPQDYSSPSSTDLYMKLQDGENRLRILSQPILGWEDWNELRKPVRYQYKDKPKPIDPKKPVKHFWSFIVWNYQEEKIQMLQITQASIRKSIEAFSKDEDWGMPYFYDLKITKSGKDMDTEYHVMPVPKKAINPSVITAFNKRRCNLDAIFENQDPFSSEHSTYTKGIFSEADLNISKVETIEAVAARVDTITHEQAIKLEDIINECTPQYKDNFKILLGKASIHSVYQLPKHMYDFIEKTASENRLENIFGTTAKPKSNEEVPF